MSKSPVFVFLKWIFIVCLIVAGAGFGYYYYSAKQQPLKKYQPEPATRGELTQAVTATGTLNPVLNVQVGSQVSGNIQKLFADWNSSVKAGQVVAQIDPTNYRATVTQAEGDLDNAKAALELANIQLKRTKDLRSKDSASQASLDQATEAVHQTAATVKTKEGSLALARANFEHCTIISPVDGIVISRNVDVGQTVAASLNAPVIFVIANDLAKMQIDTNVSEADVGNVKEGQDVDFLVDAYPSATFHGKVRQVRNAATTVQNVVTYDAVIDVENSDLKLKPGMTANVSIIVARRSDALLISNAALRVRLPEVGGTLDAKKLETSSEGPARKKNPKDPGRLFQRTIYVLPEGETMPKAVRIKIGVTDGVDTEVLEGLNAGDKVVVGVLNGKGENAPAPSTSGRRF